MNAFRKTIFLITVFSFITNFAFAQRTYTGEPVTKNGLLKTLRLRQFQTAEIVRVIVEQGVEFRLTEDIRQELIKAGARPEVIEAVRKNFRGALKVKPNNSNTYESLISRAVNIYESERNAKEAIAVLNQAANLKPSESRAYQMLGYVNLYGLKNFKHAEEYMQKAINLGGSAVFRVRHAHDYTFSYSCIGSFYISRRSIRYEDDDNAHTFQVRDADIVKIDTIGSWAGLLKRRTGLFKVVIRDKANVKDKDKYDFSTLTGKGEEAKMIVRLVGKN
jgi:tetratricopeptide (TPR) repeat protein